MNKLIRIIMAFFLISTVVRADTLEIKVDKGSVKLPYWPANKPHYGGVLIVRGGEPAQWSEFLAHFAPKMAENGWSTALLNCNTDTKIPWLTQLPEAISALRQDKNNRIVLIHYGEQLGATLDYFTKPQGKMINGLIMLSAYDAPNGLDKVPVLRFPLFDIVGQFDYDTILSQAKIREEKFQPAEYTSMQIPGAAYDYEYSQDLLISFIKGWMMKLPETAPATPPIPAAAPNVKSYIEPIYYLQSHLVAINR